MTGPTFPIDLSAVAPDMTLSPDQAAEKAAIVAGLQAHHDNRQPHGSAAEVRGWHQARLDLAERTNSLLQQMLPQAVTPSNAAALRGTIANNSEVIAKLNSHLETLANAPDDNVVSHAPV